MDTSTNTAAAVAREREATSTPGGAGGTTSTRTTTRREQVQDHGARHRAGRTKDGVTPRRTGQHHRTGRQIGKKARKADMEQRPGATTPTTTKERCRRPQKETSERSDSTFETGQKAQ
eukprot:10796185-Heterocapsa_arctica.AAC.1